MKGSHTYDVIASVLDDIHTEYGIRKKIVCTTYNGTNFVKAFSVFGEQPVDSDDDAADDPDNDGDDHDAASATAFDVYSVLNDGGAQCTYNLPVISVVLVTR